MAHPSRFSHRRFVRAFHSAIRFLGLIARRIFANASTQRAGSALFLLLEFPKPIGRTDQVRVVLRYTVFHQGSDEAVCIFEAARMQDKFEPVLGAPLEQRPGWPVHGAPQMDVAWEIAGAAGLDLAKAESDKLFPGITGILNQDMADVEAVGIRQTPTFFLNGKRLENFSAESLIADVCFAVENA